MNKRTTNCPVSRLKLIHPAMSLNKKTSAKSKIVKNIMSVNAIRVVLIIADGPYNQKYFHQHHATMNRRALRLFEQKDLFLPHTCEL